MYSGVTVAFLVHSTIHFAGMTITYKQFVGLNFLVTALILGGCSGDNHVKVLYSTEPGNSQQVVPAQWHDVQEGLTYANILVDVDGGSRKELFVVKVNPRLFEFMIVENKDRANAKTLQEIQKEEGAVLAFNGAFFDTNFKPMGLLQDSGKRVHKVLQSDLMNGIFHVNCQSAYPNVAELMSLKDYTDVPTSKSCDFWLQNGPILIDNAGGVRIGKDTGKAAGRTALGIDKDGNVVLIVVYQTLINSDNSLSLYQFAHMLAEKEPFVGMGLYSVLNLDGGPSTGVAVGGEYLPEINPVENVVITLPRKQKI